MPMDQLRMSQIREALDDDKKYYGQAFDIVKRNIRQNQQEASPAYVTLNQDDIKSIGEKINEMLPLLENKYISLDTLRRGASDESDSSEIAAVEDVIAAYNVVISVFLNPSNTNQTREALMTGIMRMEKYIAALEKLCQKLLTTWSNPHATNLPDTTVLVSTLLM